MRIDDFDNTIICEDLDMSYILSAFKEFRIVNEYIEQGILKIVCNEMGSEFKGNNTINQQFDEMPESLISNIVKNINTMFNKNDNIIYDDMHISYLIYYLPINIFKIWKPLIDLLIGNTLSADLEVLDIGTGPGSIPIGIIEFYKILANKYKEIGFSIKFTLIEKEEEFIQIATEMINIVKNHIPNNMKISISNAYADTIVSNYKNELLGKYDLITMSNFLANNELDNNLYSTNIVNSFYGNLDEAGSLIIINPGDLENSRSLNFTRNKLINEGKYNLYSPCVSIWEEKKEYNCSCFNMTRLYYEIPVIHKCLADKGLKKNLREGIPFNYLVLRKDGLKKYRTELNQRNYIKLKDLGKYDGMEVSVCAIIRTVIKRENNFEMTLCDGSRTFKSYKDSIFLIIDLEYLRLNNIDIPLIAGEKITIKSANVDSGKNSIRVVLNKHSKIRIDY